MQDIYNYMPRWKRAVDIFFCLLALPFLITLMVLALPVMLITSPGPILFTQDRIGLKGKVFKLYKFRTMHLDSCTSHHESHFKKLKETKSAMIKLDAKHDKRLIFGSWLLRATGLDELPQILNVLKGDMSIVGPRPCTVYEYKEYTDAEKERLNAVPGLTGLWQVSGKNRTTFEQMIHFDVEYTKAKNFWMDCYIIFMTPVALIVQLIDTLKARHFGINPPEVQHNVVTRTYKTQSGISYTVNKTL